MNELVLRKVIKGWFKPILSFTFLLLVLQVFSCKLSAQTASLIPDLCGRSIQYGEPIFCIANDSAVEYEFKFFTRKDSVVISTLRNYLLVDEYKDKIRTHVNFNIAVRCKFGNNWGQYGDTCSSQIYIDGFEDILSKVGRIDEPIIAKRSEDIDDDEEYIIPIVFHVVVPATYHGSNLVDYLPPEKIYESLRILNDVYSGRTGIEADRGADTKIRFCMAKKDRNSNVIKLTHNEEEFFGITYIKIDGSENINANGLTVPTIYPNANPIYSPNCSYYNKFPRNKYLNIFIFENLGNNTAGKAWSDYFGENSIGYVSLIKEVVGTNSTPDRGLGYSLPHEVGHFLGLYHTWHNPNEINPGIISLDTCCACDNCSSDYVDDTYCHLHPSTNCDISSNEPINNIMNYTHDGCRRIFTKGQKDRMRMVIRAVYSELINNNVARLCVDENFPPNIFATQILTPSEYLTCSNSINSNSLKIIKTK